MASSAPAYGQAREQVTNSLELRTNTHKIWRAVQLRITPTRHFLVGLSRGRQRKLLGRNSDEYTAGH
jgi:hypothetical protein